MNPVEMYVLYSEKDQKYIEFIQDPNSDKHILVTYVNAASKHAPDHWKSRSKQYRYSKPKATDVWNQKVKDGYIRELNYKINVIK